MNTQENADRRYDDDVQDALSPMALDGSVQKWSNNIKRAKHDREVAVRWVDCPLCLLYGKDECARCPVKQVSGVPHCSNTPYVWVMDTLVEMEIGIEDGRYSQELKRQLVLHCTCEHEFLTLLSQGETEKAREVIQWMHDYWT